MSGRPLRTSWRVGKAATAVDLRLDGERVAGKVGGSAVEAVVRRAGTDGVVVTTERASTWATVVRDGARLLVAVDGETWVLEPVEEGAEGGAPASSEPFATSPMTGTVVQVAVAAGAKAAKGSPLFVVEAMKMEYAVKAPRDLVVADVRRKAGEKVALGEVVVTFAEGP